MRNRVYIMLLCISLFGILAGSVLGAVPAGPTTITSIKNETLPVRGSSLITAVAGNVSEMNINSWSVTRTWQGYYGNITGTIVLADASNYTLYDWSNTNPNGRVYATRKAAVVTWSAIRCANKTELDVTEAEFSGTNETDRNNLYPIDRPNATFVNSTDYTRGDGVTNFNITYANYSTFWVGPVQINGTFNSTGGSDPTQCFSTALDNSTTDVDQSPMAGNDLNHWREVLLSDGSGASGTVYTAIIEQSYTGFDGKAHDFQMIVPENGHGTDVATTNYYFYIELE